MDIMLAHKDLLESTMLIRKEAARRMRHFYTGTHEWSPEWTNLEKNSEILESGNEKVPHTDQRTNTATHDETSKPARRSAQKNQKRMQSSVGGSKEQI